MKYILLVCALCGCAVQFTGAYDPVIDQGLTEFQKTMDLHLLGMQTAPAAFRQGFFDTTLAGLYVLRSRASALPMNETTVKDIQRLIADADSTNATERRGGASSLFFMDMQQRIDNDCGRALKVELARKR